MGNGVGGFATISEQRMIGEQGISYLHQRLDTVGDGSGTKDMATTADEYFIEPAATQVAYIETLRFIIRMSGDFPWEEFAATTGALATGCLLKIKQNNASTFTTVKDLLTGTAITINADFLHFGEVSTSISTSNDSVLVATFLFRQIMGYPIILRGDRNFLLSFETQDDLSALTSFECWASGCLRSV
jgi:hypothetical protein